MNETTVVERHLDQSMLIVLTERALNNTEALDEIFEILWKNTLIKSHVLSQDDSELWSLYRFISHFKGNCFKLKHVKIETFKLSNHTERTTLPLERLLSKDLDNFQECPLFVAASIYSPFVIIQNSSMEWNRTEFKGIDIEIVDQMSKVYNFTSVYRGPKPDEGTGHGFIFKNGTVTENLALVYFHS